MSRFLVVRALIILVAALVAVSTVAAEPTVATEEEPVFVDLAGHDVHVSQHLGHIVVLNFWATWCGPCRAEIPALQRVHEKFGPRGVHLIGASANGRDDAAVVKALLDPIGVTYEVWLWVAAKDMRHWGVGPAIPATVVLDPKGAIRATFRGAVTEAQLTPVLERLLAETAEAGSPSTSPSAPPSPSATSPSLRATPRTSR